MASLPQPDNRLYLGRGGSGKTTLALQHAAKFPRVLLVLPDDSEHPAYPAVRDRRALIEAMMAPRFKVAFVTDCQIEEWEWANEASLAAGNCLVVWEEAGVFMGGGGLRDRTPFAFDLWMRGRHFRNRVFACSQRPASVSADCRANLARAVIFNTTEPNDLKFFRSMIGGGDIVPAIRALDFAGHEAIDWTPSGWKMKRAPFA